MLLRWLGRGNMQSERGEGEENITHRRQFRNLGVIKVAFKEVCCRNSQL
jgi:hypothetical protein